MSDENVKHEWDDEPDTKAFRHAGLECWLNRNRNLGCWCGYVGVPPKHPYHGKAYSEEFISCGVHVHGGLTYSSSLPPGKTVDDRGLWWFGFDCARCDDLLPKHDAKGGPEIYRNIHYVEAQCRELANQLANLRPTSGINLASNDGLAEDLTDEGS